MQCRSGAPSRSPYRWAGYSRLLACPDGVGAILSVVCCFDGRVVSVEREGDLGFGVAEPVAGPDSVEVPPEVLEVLLSQAVSRAGGGCRVVRGTVGLDGEDHLAGSFGVFGGEVDPVASNA